MKIAMATTPKSTGESSRARTTMLITPMPRMIQRAATAQAVPEKMSRITDIGGTSPSCSLRRAALPRILAGRRLVPGASIQLAAGRPRSGDHDPVID